MGNNKRSRPRRLLLLTAAIRFDDGVEEDGCAHQAWFACEYFKMFNRYPRCEHDEPAIRCGPLQEQEIA